MLVELRLKVQVRTAALWLTVKVWPAMVSVPTRCVPVLAATEKLTVPLPTTVAPAVMVNHEALLVAAQLQLPGVAVTETELFAPLAGAATPAAARL